MHICKAITMLSRIFKSGNSQAVRIPKELAFDVDMQDVEVIRKGETLVIRAVSRQTLGGVMKAFAAFPPGFMSEGRDINEQSPRAWDVRAIAKRKKVAR
jgi:antitoxin VapB